MKNISFMLFLLFWSFSSYSFDKFDAKVCEASANDSARIQCYKESGFPTKCENAELSKELACYRDIGRELEKEVINIKSVTKDPYQQPFQYVGMSVVDASKSTGVMPNKVDNIIVDSEQYHMILEASEGYISYVDVMLKKTSPCSQSVPFNPEPVLSALGINSSELEFVNTETHLYVYNDHKHKLKVNVTCLSDGEPLSVSFSSKYYGGDTNSSSSTLSNSGSRLSKSPEDIAAECFAEAGLRKDEPSHKVTPEELNNVLKCSSRYIKK
jgi:hypothetical protein